MIVINKSCILYITSEVLFVMKDKYRVVLTCWDYGEPKPYSDYFTEMFDSYEDAYTEIKKCAKNECDSLNEPTISQNENEGRFKVDFDENECAIVRLWEYADCVETDNDYMPVTAYNIYKLEEYEDFYKYRGVYIHKRGKKFAVESFDTIIHRSDKLENALKFVDDFILAFQEKHKYNNAVPSEVM